MRRLLLSLAVLCFAACGEEDPAPQAEPEAPVEEPEAPEPEPEPEPDRWPNEACARGWQAAAQDGWSGGRIFAASSSNSRVRTSAS